MHVPMHKNWQWLATPCGLFSQRLQLIPTYSEHCYFAGRSSGPCTAGHRIPAPTMPRLAAARHHMRQCEVRLDKLAWMHQHQHCQRALLPGGAAAEQRVHPMRLQSSLAGIAQVVQHTVLHTQQFSEPYAVPPPSLGGVITALCILFQPIYSSSITTILHPDGPHCPCSNQGIILHNIVHVRASAQSRGRTVSGRH